MRYFKLITVFAGVMIWVLGFHAASFAQTSNNKINNSKAGQDMRDVKQNPGGAFDGYGNRTTPVQGSSGAKPSAAGQPKSLYKPAAARTMKSVDHTKVPAPSTNRSSSPSRSSSSGSSGSKSSTSSSSSRKK